VIVALGSLTGFFVLQSRVNDLQHNNERLQAQLDQATQRDNNLLTAVLSPQSVMAPIVATKSNESAGRLVWNDDQHKCWLVFDNLAALPAGETYQLWAESNGTYWSLGTFHTDTTGVMQYTAEVSHDIADYKSAVVTIEKAGGSETMTGAPVYRADLSGAK
jgi:anti-sigma-K factor RskA